MGEDQQSPGPGQGDPRGQAGEPFSYQPSDDILRHQKVKCASALHSSETIRLSNNIFKILVIKKLFKPGVGVNPSLTFKNHLTLYFYFLYNLLTYRVSL